MTLHLIRPLSCWICREQCCLLGNALHTGTAVTVTGTGAFPTSGWRTAKKRQLLLGGGDTMLLVRAAFPSPSESCGSSAAALWVQKSSLPLTCILKVFANGLRRVSSLLCSHDSCHPKTISGSSLVKNVCQEMGQSPRHLSKLRVGNKRPREISPGAFSNEASAAEGQRAAAKHS